MFSFYKIIMEMDKIDELEEDAGNLGLGGAGEKEVKKEVESKEKELKVVEER
jgi:hypothetical protein